MKKSNIILISILAIFMLLSTIISFHLKYALSNLDERGIELSFDNYSTINIGEGWRVILNHGNDTKIIISEDSIKNYISLIDNTLTLKDINRKGGRVKVAITNNLISQISTNGNSIFIYDAEYIDSIFVVQNGHSKVILQNDIKIDNSGNLKIEKTGNIDYVNIKLNNHSRFEAYVTIQNLTGELNDTSNCKFTEEVAMSNFSKSKMSKINSW